MRYSNKVMNLIIIGLMISMILPLHNVAATYYIYENKFLSDNAIDECTTRHGFWGGNPQVLCDDIDDLRLEVSPDWAQEEHATILIDGKNSNPWTFSSSYYFSLKVYWKMKGHYEISQWAFPDYFNFIYNLYYISGNTEISVKSYTYEQFRDGTITAPYQYEGGWDTLTLVTHSLGSVNVDISKTYYFEIDIRASIRNDYFGEVNFWGGSDHIEFVKAEFAYEV